MRNPPTCGPCTAKRGNLRAHLQGICLLFHQERLCPGRGAPSPFLSDEGTPLVLGKSTSRVSLFAAFGQASSPIRRRVAVGLSLFLTL